MWIGLVCAIALPLLGTAQNSMLKFLGYQNKKEDKDFSREELQVRSEADAMMGLITSWASAGVAFLIVAAVMVWLGGLSQITELSSGFWWAVIWKAPVYAVAVWSYALAHRKGDMSLISPLLAITPAIIIIIAPITIGQTASWIGVVGIMLIVVGAYLLNLFKIKDGLTAPIKELWKDHGARFMILTATLYAFTSIIDSIGVDAAKASGNNFFFAAILWTIFINLASVLVLSPFALYFVVKLRNNRNYKDLPAVLEFIGKKSAKKMSLLGFFNGAGEVFQMIAMSFMPVAYINAIKRFSMVLGVLVGGKLFKEERWKERLLGSVVMMVGVVAVVIDWALMKGL